MSLWYVGAMLSAVGSVSSNLGVNIQKYSFMKNAKLDPELQKSYARQPLWFLGLCLVVLGSLGDFAALGLAAQSIVAPIASITLVSNVLFAHFGLKEPLSRRDIIGTCLIILGSTLSVAFGNHAETSYTMEELKDLYGQMGFIIYMLLIFVACSLLYLVIKRLQPIKAEMVEKCSEYEQALLAQPRDSQLIEDLDFRIAELELKYEGYERVHPFTYCALSGCLGAQSILFGKMVAEMIAESMRGSNQMIYPLTYAFLIGMFVCIFTQLHFLALGLKYFDALYVVPVFQCFFISVSTLGGAAYFGEFAEFSLFQAIMFPCGIASTLIGVFILSSRKMKVNIARTDADGARVAIVIANGSDVPLSDRVSAADATPDEVSHIQLLQQNSSRAPFITSSRGGDECEENFVSPLGREGWTDDALDDVALDDGAATTTTGAGRKYAPSLKLDQTRLFTAAASGSPSPRRHAAARPSSACHSDKRMSRFAQRRVVVNESALISPHGGSRTAANSRRGSRAFAFSPPPPPAAAKSKRATWTDGVFRAAAAVLGGNHAQQATH